MDSVEQMLEREEWAGSLARRHPEHFSVKDRILGVIEEGYSDPDFTVRDITAAVGLSERRIREILHETPEPTSLSAELDQKRMNRARLLLVETNWAIEMVAIRCGYRSASSFSRRFKAVNFQSPQEYRSARGGPARAGGATGAFKQAAARHRAAVRGLPEPPMQRTGELPGESEARWSEMHHAVRQAQLRGEIGRSASIAEEARVWGERVKKKRGERGV